MLQQGEQNSGYQQGKNHITSGPIGVEAESLKSFSDRALQETVQDREGMGTVEFSVQVRQDWAGQSQDRGQGHGD
jgi:hypothetical protein